MEEFIEELDKILRRTNKNNPITSKQIAEILGLLEVKVSKWMKKLRKQGCIAFDEKKISIMDHADYLFKQNCDRTRQKKCFVYWRIQ